MPTSIDEQRGCVSMVRSDICRAIAFLAFMFASFSTSAPTMTLPGELNGGMFNVRATSFKGSPFKSVYKQRYGYSCGSASLASLLTFHYEDPVSEDIVFLEMYGNGDPEKIEREGFSLLDMKRYLENHGYQADGFRASLDQLAKTGIPAITIINTEGYPHFVVIKGLSDQKVLVGDPATGNRVVGQDQFESSRDNQVLFVIRNKVEIGRRHFNGE